jgi:YD repeat-containing protein
LPSIKNSTKPENGLPYRKIYYNLQGDKIGQDEFEYSNKESSLYYGVKIGGFSTKLEKCYTPETDCPTFSPYQRHILGYYPIFDFESLVTKKTNKQYTGNDSIVSCEEYTYDINNFVRTIAFTNSNGQTFTTLNRRPIEYTYSAPYNKMIERNILSPVVQTLTRIEGSIKAVSGEKINFSEYDSPFGKIYKPQNVSYLLNDDNANSENYSAYWKQKLTLAYNNYGHLLTVQDMESNISTTYLWGYEEQYPVAKIVGTTYDELMSNMSIQTKNYLQYILQQNLTPSHSMYHNLRTIITTAVPNAQVTTYTYKPLVGMTSQTDPRGITSYFEYDSFGRLQRTKLIDDILQDFEYHYK